jgi:vancomycin resistance protein YoaR
MTWDKLEPRDQARPTSSQPNGPDGPGWWSEPSQPAPKKSASVRSAATAQSVRGTTLAKSDANGSSNGSSTQANGILEARRSIAPRIGGRTRSRNSNVSTRVVVGFAVGAFGALFLATAAVFGLSRAYDGKIMPGVHAGSLDLSGLTRDEAIGKINSTYASLGQGKITVTTPTGTGIITYEQAGRGPDSVAMADAAMAAGRGNDPLSSAAATLRIFTGGASIPVIVKLDPLALETKLHEITGSSLVPAKDAQVSTSGSGFTVVPGATGRGLDEVIIASELIDQLAKADAPSELQAGGTFVTVDPNVSDAQAQAAIDSAGKMSVEVTLASGDKTWKIAAATVRTWIVFGVRSDGTYGPVADPTQVKGYVAALASKVNVDPKEPKVILASGKPNGLSAGTPGLALDVDATSQAIEAYLDGLGSGGANTGASIALVTNVVQPTITDPALTGFVVISQVVTTYFPGESNGFGTNIALPAQLLNGQVVGVGEQFSMLQRVGPITAARGWKLGGVIVGGVSNHTGAIGGGICSASTTMFQVAALAGLKINERHAHFYWIDRYALSTPSVPKGIVGLDATVYSNGNTTWDMRFTNDTQFPIVIKSWISGGRSQAAIHIQLWSKPNGRKTVFSKPVVTDQVKAGDGKQYVSSLPGGLKTYRKEYPTAGFRAYVTRTVTDATGAVLHYDQYHSSYTKVDGILQIVGTPKPTPGPPTPTPGPPTPTPKPTLPPVVLPSAAPSAASSPRKRNFRP